MEALENGGGGCKTTRKKKLTIEKYLDFIDNRTLHLTVSQLRQIISMHGFKKIRAGKNILTEMVTTMELMDLHRSTLLDGGVSADACLTLDEVINDLKLLNWQECQVTSLLAFSAGDPASSSSANSIASLKRKRPKKSGKKAVDVAADNSVNCSSGTTIAMGSTTESSREFKFHPPLHLPRFFLQANQR